MMTGQFQQWQQQQMIKCVNKWKHFETNNDQRDTDNDRDGEENKDNVEDNGKTEHQDDICKERVTITVQSCTRHASADSGH